MKARKRVRRFHGFMVGGLFFALCQAACGQSFSERKNLHQLEESVFPVMHTKYPTTPLFIEKNNARTTPATFMLFRAPLPNPQSLIPNQPFLPRWSAESLPFFCRIEHDVAKKSAVPFRFRLGSVEYVDWLEGKGSDWGY